MDPNFQRAFWMTVTLKVSPPTAPGVAQEEPCSLRASSPLRRGTAHHPLLCSGVLLLVSRVLILSSRVPYIFFPEALWVSSHEKQHFCDPPSHCRIPVAGMPIGPALVRGGWTAEQLDHQMHWLKYDRSVFLDQIASQGYIPGQQVALSHMAIQWPRVLPAAGPSSPRALSPWKGNKNLQESCCCLKSSSHCIAWKSVLWPPHLQEGLGNMAWLSPSKREREMGFGGKPTAPPQTPFLFPHSSPRSLASDRKSVV